MARRLCVPDEIRNTGLTYLTDDLREALERFEARFPAKGQTDK